jgi:hypothetical protein
MPRNDVVQTTPLVGALRDDPDQRGAPPEDVVALVGFVGEAGDPDQFVRLHPSPDLQAWMEFPRGDVYNSAPVDPDRPNGQTIVWIDRESLEDNSVFKEEAAAALAGQFEDGGPEMTVWQLLPASRYVAAELIGLIDGGEGRY